MDGWQWTDAVWAPVAIKGFALDYEMCPLGYVRRKDSRPGAGPLWLLPRDEGDGPFYRLRAGGDVAELYVRDILRLFGACPGSVPGAVANDGADDGAVGPCERSRGAGRGVRIDAAWLADTRRRALAENARSRRWDLDAARLAGLCEDGEADLEQLALTLERGCPWGRARLSGDARGADPVLGF